MRQIPLQQTVQTTAALTRRLVSLATFLLLTWLPAGAPLFCSELPRAAGAPASLKSLHVQPKVIRIDGMNRRQQLLVTAETDSGQRFDVTGHCSLSARDSDVVAAAGSVVTGVSDGRTVLRVNYRSLTAAVPVVVTGFDRYPPIHFENDIVPLFSKLGCNSGGCHGKQSGQNGFRLSVFGFDPRFDFNALVKESRGRRIFPADPEKSLLVAKANGRAPHGGGRRIAPGSPDHALLAEWVRQGTPWGDENAPQLVSLRISPTERVMAMKSEQQILVTAVYSDGRRRDVTRSAAYSSNAAQIAAADQQGCVRSGHIPGEAAITVHYRERVGVVKILVPRPGAPNPYPETPRHNKIDGFVWAKLKKMGIVPSALCDDATFFRRLHVDAIGTLPTPDAVRAFLANQESDKRTQAIHKVLDRDEVADYWALRFADVLLVDRETLGERGAYEFHRWLRDQLARNRPYDEWVRELLTATGSSGKVGPVNFFRALRTPEELTTAISQALLGIRLDCAQCHHHPFEKWAQEDFFGLAGFFNGVERKPLRNNREFVYHAGYRTTKLPLTGQTVPTRPPGGDVPAGIENVDPRVPLAQWLTSPENPWFARLIANRLWKQFLGRGLVEPEDDFRSTNPATNEPLLAYLTRQVVENRFDLKAVSRLILNSRVYQLSSIPNDTNFDDTQNFSHYSTRRLRAEVLLDSISQVTGSPEKFPGLPLGTRSIQLWDNRLPSYFLDTFGRSERKSPCECGVSNEPTMSQALHLMNAPEIEEKITVPTGRVARLVAAGAQRDKLVAELCLAALGRPPGEKERRIAAGLFADAPPKQAAEDFLWTLLNSYDFLFVR